MHKNNKTVHILEHTNIGLLITGKKQHCINGKKLESWYLRCDIFLRFLMIPVLNHEL